ncbi:MAG: glycosyltransferase family 2 protein [Clostridium sp.]|nr:glycosyltransferase family 2 protein [Clostridium sp.]
MYKLDDIQIFITTHNRAEFLKDAINSLLMQTAGAVEITVLDNESTDNTESVVKEFSCNNVKYIRTKGFLGNYKKAKELVSKDYVMLFHDDDLLHPQYLEFVLSVLNTQKTFHLSQQGIKLFQI